MSSRITMVLLWPATFLSVLQYFQAEGFLVRFGVCGLQLVKLFELFFACCSFVLNDLYLKGVASVMWYHVTQGTSLTMSVSCAACSVTGGYGEGLPHLDLSVENYIHSTGFECLLFSWLQHL